MQRTNIYLAEEQTERLDHLAREEGISRAELIRRLLDRALGGHESGLEADLARIDYSFGAAADIEMPTRERSARAKYLDELMGGTDT